MQDKELRKLVKQSVTTATTNVTVVCSFEILTIAVLILRATLHIARR